MLYLSGIQSEKVLTEDIISKVVSLKLKKKFLKLKIIIKWFHIKTIEDLILNIHLLEKELSSGQNWTKNYLLKNQKNIQILMKLLKKLKNIFHLKKKDHDLEKIIRWSNSEEWI